MSKKLNKNVPKLRFPEFKGDWEYLKIEDIASVTSGGTPNRSEPSFWNGNIPWVTTSEIGQAEIHGSVEKITEKGLQNSSAKIFKKDTILLAMYGQGKTRGQVSILKIEAATNQACAAIALKSGFNLQFVYYFLFKEYENLRGLANDGSQKNLTAGLIKQYKVPVTHINEQEKIASFLGAVDRRLTQLRRKQELLQTYKRGVIQKLFSQQIRFTQPDGSPFPDWEEKTLEEVCDITSSKRVYLHDYVKEGIPFYRGKEITEIKKNIKPVDILYITEDRYQEFKNKYGVPIIGDILITAVGTLGNVLKIRNNEKFYFKDGNLIWLRKANKNINVDFLEILLENSQNQLLKTSIGSTQKALTIVGLKKISLFFPYLEEQEKIANFLTAIDRKIEAISSQIDQTEQLKKGLLQKMFV
ncbi:hypothetical protein A6769_10365 [Nostoc punctiforme NIES-2108]|uniref:Type I restriction modification DNA specificity domain-containing protein n=1 Tax=Nostoc punctiforme NIES-2108 TaxID=1356359 RepID=A0A367RS72_NOSPU|nr:hypothetical protein A6769_10365 [Nostoc punctiforme NIES-2108]